MLHLLSPVRLAAELKFCHALLAPHGRILILHYLGRTEHCFTKYTEIFATLRRSEKWAGPLAGASHRTAHQLQADKQCALSGLLENLEAAKFRVTAMEETFTNVIINQGSLEHPFRIRKS